MSLFNNDDIVDSSCLILSITDCNIHTENGKKENWWWKDLVIKTLNKKLNVTEYYFCNNNEERMFEKNCVPAASSS